jgi:glycosyltransferase involved in cell wall biosynthesis
MKVVVAHNQYSSAAPSGENVIVDAEISQLRAAGVEVVAFLRSSDGIAALPAWQKALLPVAPVYAGAAQRELREILRTHRPDVVHLHNPYPLISPWVVRTAHAAGVPVVQTVHNYRHICVNGVYFRDGAVCTDCLGRRFPVPAVAHGCYRGSRAQSVVMAATVTLHRPTWRSVDQFVALTDPVAEHLRGYGIAEERITVKPNSVPDPFAGGGSGGGGSGGGGSGGAGADAHVAGGFLFLGRLCEEKGVRLLLQAWREHEDGSLGPLRIAGDGPLRELVKQAAAERGDLHYLGLLDRNGVREAMLASCTVVVASVWHDVLPGAILEALSFGRPVLGTNLGGIPYAIGDAGWVVEPTAAALAAALPRAAREAAGRSVAARARYRTTFHPDVVLGKLLDIYAGVVRRP